MKETIGSQIEQPKFNVLDYIKERSAELGPEMEKNYTDFHENPELGGEEFETGNKVAQYLKQLDIEILGEKIGNSGLGNNLGLGKGSSVVARIKGKQEGMAIALRADMD